MDGPVGALRGQHGAGQPERDGKVTEGADGTARKSIGLTAWPELSHTLAAHGMRRVEL